MTNCTAIVCSDVKTVLFVCIGKWSCPSVYETVLSQVLCKNTTVIRSVFGCARSYTIVYGVRNRRPGDVQIKQEEGGSLTTLRYDRWKLRLDSTRLWPIGEQTNRASIISIGRRSNDSETRKGVEKSLISERDE